MDECRQGYMCCNQFTVLVSDKRDIIILCRLILGPLDLICCLFCFYIVVNIRHIIYCRYSSYYQKHSRMLRRHSISGSFDLLCSVAFSCRMFLSTNEKTLENTFSLRIQGFIIILLSSHVQTNINRAWSFTAKRFDWSTSDSFVVLAEYVYRNIDLRCVITWYVAKRYGPSAFWFVRKSACNAVCQWQICMNNTITQWYLNAWYGDGRNYPVTLKAYCCGWLGITVFGRTLP